MESRFNISRKGHDVFGGQTGGGRGVGEREMILRSLQEIYTFRLAPQDGKNVFEKVPNDKENPISGNFLEVQEICQMHKMDDGQIKQQGVNKEEETQEHQGTCQL